MSRPNALRRGLSALLAVLVTSTLSQAQIVTENAGVEPPETPILRELFGTMDAERGHEFLWSQQAIFSLDRDNEFKLTLPFSSRELEVAGNRTTYSGLADASLRWKRALLKEDEVMSSNRWALLSELTAPTGDDRDEADGSAIPPGARLSRGDWAVGVGTAYTRIRDRHRFSVEGFYRHWSAHDGVQLGDSVDANLAYWYRLAPARFGAGDPVVEIRGVLELLTTYFWPTEIGGVNDSDDGVRSYLAPGLQVFPRDWLLLEASVGIPVAETVDDAFGSRHFTALLTVKFLF